MKQLFIVVNVLVEFIAIYNCVSSAYWAWLTPNDSITPAIGATYNANRHGPRHEPWGIPNSLVVVIDCIPPTLTNCERSFTYDCNHCNAVPVIPKVRSTRWTNVFKSIVSNAADRSSSTSSDLDFLSAAPYTSSVFAVEPFRLNNHACMPIGTC